MGARLSGVFVGRSSDGARHERHAYDTASMGDDPLSNGRGRRPLGVVPVPDLVQAFHRANSVLLALGGRY